RDAGQQGRGLLLGGAAALERLGLDLLRVGLALLGVRLLDVLEDHLDAGLGADIGDAGAHHAGAEDADLGELGLGDLRAVRSLGARAARGAVLMSKKNAWIMFFDTVPVTSETKYRASICSAVAKSTCEPSTAADMMARGAGEGAP